MVTICNLALLKAGSVCLLVILHLLSDTYWLIVFRILYAIFSFCKCKIFRSTSFSNCYLVHRPRCTTSFVTGCFYVYAVQTCPLKKKDFCLSMFQTHLTLQLFFRKCRAVKTLQLKATLQITWHDKPLYHDVSFDVPCSCRKL